MAPIKTTVLGSGMSLQVFHYPLIASHPELFTLHSVLERSAEVSDSGEVTRSKARDRCGPNIKICRTLEEVLSDPEVELVVIGLPPKQHFEYAKKCLEAGKHILIEKPITVHAQDGKALIELAQQKKLVLYTFQNRRWDADFLAVQEVLKSGKLGQLNEFTSHYDRYKPIAALPDPTVWKEQPGHANDSIYNLGAHLIDQALMLFGRPQEVLGISWPIRGLQGLDDSFLLHMRYPSSHALSKPYPLLVTLAASILSPMSSQLRFSIKGDKGSFTKFGLDPQEAAMKAFKPGGTKIGDEEWGKEDPSLYGTLEVVNEDLVTFSRESVPTPNGSYQLLYQDLHKAITERLPLEQYLVNPYDSVQTIEVVEAGMLSSKEGRWVQL